MDPNFSVPWLRVGAFIRQHAHDIRNRLNGMDLEVALIQETAKDPEAIESARRLHHQIRNAVIELAKLSEQIADRVPTLTQLPLSALLQTWQEQAELLDPKADVVWRKGEVDADVEIDLHMMQVVLRELLVNARDFSMSAKVIATFYADPEFGYLELREPKFDPLDTSLWGLEPLHTTRRDGYGLGLWSVRKSVEAMRGMITHVYLADSGELVTTLRFVRR